MKRSCARLVTVVGAFPKNTVSCYCASNNCLPSGRSYAICAYHNANTNQSLQVSVKESDSHLISSSVKTEIPSVQYSVFKNCNAMTRISPVWRRSSSSSPSVFQFQPGSVRSYSSDSSRSSEQRWQVMDRVKPANNTNPQSNLSSSSSPASGNTHLHLGSISMPVLTEDESCCSISSQSASTLPDRNQLEVDYETSFSNTTKAKVANSSTSSPAVAAFSHGTSFTPIRTVVTSQILVDVSREGIMDQPKLLSKEEREGFMSMYHQLVKELLEIPDMKDMEETNRWMARVLQYNVPHGKRNRGLSTALAYKYLAPEELTEENVRLSYVLGWCVEMLQAFFLVSDDIMDGSETRRGRPCWYKVDNLGLAAINDALLLEACIYKILQKHFGGKACYSRVMEVMHDVTYKTIFGQSLDTRTGQERRMETYTMERYSSIVKYKTSYYSFYLPVALAMAMCDIKDPKVIQQVRKVTLEMGHFFQVQDDYLDCFGDVEVTGKIGTDIQDCKCSWLFVVAMQRCNPDQKKFLLENYGKHEPDRVEAIKKLYKDLALEEVYQRYEEQTYNMICTHIQQMNDELPKGLFYDVLHKIYKRSS